MPSIYGSSQTNPNYVGYSGRPVPTITPYLAPNQGGNANVPVGQTGTPYSQGFIGPIPYERGVVGQPVTTSKIYRPTQTYNPPANNPTPSTPQPDYNNVINQGVQDGNDSIERDFQDALAQADTAEQGLRSQAGQATSELNLQGTQTKNALESQRGTAEAGIVGQEQTANTQAKSGMQQARDLFRQTQQGNIAQLSALGLSSSSVMEGLAEKLGVETARRIGGITGSLNEVMQNLSKERARVNEYAKAKTLELEQGLQTQLAGIQSQLLQGIRQIQDSRQLAATAKANARADMMNQARQQVYQLQNSAQQFAQQLQQWSAQKSATLDEASKSFTVTPTDFTNLNNANANIQSITGVGGQLAGYQPSFSIAPTGKFTTTLKPKAEDEITNPFQ